MTNFTFPLAKFHWNRQVNLLTAEASDLGIGMLAVNAHTPTVIRIRSHHTGRTVAYAVHYVHRDREGDTQAWDLSPLGPDNTRLPRVTIFND